MTKLERVLHQAIFFLDEDYVQHDLIEEIEDICENDERLVEHFRAKYPDMPDDRLKQFILINTTYSNFIDYLLPHYSEEMANYLAVGSIRLNPPTKEVLDDLQYDNMMFTEREHQFIQRMIKDVVDNFANKD